LHVFSDGGVLPHAIESRTPPEIVPQAVVRALLRRLGSRRRCGAVAQFRWPPVVDAHVALDRTDQVLSQPRAR
jgi:hypothetical protein